MSEQKLQQEVEDLQREVERLHIERDVWSREAGEERARHGQEVDELRDTHRANLIQVQNNTSHYKI